MRKQLGDLHGVDLFQDREGAKAKKDPVPVFRL